MSLPSAVSSASSWSYSLALRLQATSSLSATRSTLAWVVTWSPGWSRASFAPCCTRTSPWSTETREPLVPLLTAKMVPVTETRASRVATYRWRLRCLAARTMIRPRSSWMVFPLWLASSEKPARSLISISEPSAIRTRAVEPLAVRISSPCATESPAPTGRLVSPATR